MIEKEIIPLFYNRGEDKLPRGWIAMMKNSMRTLGPFFNTHRMVREYSERFYFKAYEKRLLLMNNKWKKAKEFSAWKQKVYQNWNNVKFISIAEELKGVELKVGNKYPITAEVELGDLTPKDIDVQIYYGKIDNGEKDKNFVTMTYVPKKSKDNRYTYRGEIECVNTGQFGFTLRILPKHELLINQFELGLIRWA
jgi:starch phosphorylase